MTKRCLCARVRTPKGLNIIIIIMLSRYGKGFLFQHGTDQNFHLIKLISAINHMREERFSMVSSMT